MHLAKAEVRQAWESDRRKERRKFRIILGIFVLVFLLCLCFRYQAYFYDEKFVIGAHFKSLFEGLRITIGGIFDPAIKAHGAETINIIGQDLYMSAIARLKVTAMAAVSGAGCAMAGVIFQTIYKNPMASPGMLGATAGVRLGNILMITLYSAMALEMIIRRYVFCYAFAAACVVLVIILGKAAGDRRGNPSVMKMVMAGSVISQGLNVFAMYYMYELTDEDLVIYEQLTMGTYIQYDWLSLVIFFSAMAISLIPMFLLRYRFNTVAMDYAEAVTSGANPGRIRMIGQICGVIMVTAAMVHAGDTGMIGMVVPYAVRQWVGADSKKVLVYSAFAGAIILMICRLITSLFTIEGVEIPIGFIMNMFMTPAMMLILAKNRRGFEE